MGTTPPSDLSHCLGSAQSAVPIVEGRKCSTCNSPIHAGDICLCTPSGSSEALLPKSSPPENKLLHLRQQRLQKKDITPSDISQPHVTTDQLPESHHFRRQLFKSEPTSNLDNPGPGTSSTVSMGGNTSEGDSAPVVASGSRIRHCCTCCPKSFSSPGKLSQHMYSHTGERPFVCQHCSKAFSSKFKLVRHALIHSDLRQYTCPICERTFHRKDHLKNHAKVHDPIKSLYACERPGCGKEYTSLLSYRKHVAVHAAEDGNLECTMCGLKFETKEEIVFHLKVHAGSRTVKTEEDRKYRCDRCNRSFFTGKDVRRHMVVHTGKRDFLCQYCPQRFGRKDHLVRHIKKSHNSNGKKAKTKRPEAKTKSVSTIIAETEFANLSGINVFKSTQKEQKMISLPGHSGDKRSTITSEEAVLPHPSTSTLHQTVPRLMYRDVATISEDPEEFSLIVPSYQCDIKPEPLPEFVSVDELPQMLILPEHPQIQSNPSQFLTADEPHHISRHIMNLTASGSSGSDPDLIIPSFMSPPDSDQSAVPANTTPLPGFNQAFQQQPP